MFNPIVALYVHSIILFLGKAKTLVVILCENEIISSTTITFVSDLY